jgi:anti-sigma B factor antagonist
MGEALTIEARHERGYPVVTVAGEIDIATAARLRERLFELAAGGRPLVADLDQVRFIDSAGLAALVGAAKRAAAHGGSLHVVCARPKVRQLFRLTGLDRRLPPARTRPGSPGGEDREQLPPPGVGHAMGPCGLLPPCDRRRHP